MPRSITKILDSYPAEPAPGLHVMRPLPGPELDYLDPFLMLDHFGPLDVAPGSNGGLNPHPHRGFETVTIMLEGAMEHHDSAGNRGVIKPGDVQWMTAASGIVHAEYHEKEFAKNGGVLHGIQLWVNLPARLKMNPPGYQDLPNTKIPIVKKDGAELHLIAGEIDGIRGAARTHTPMMVVRIVAAQSAQITIPIPQDFNAGIYVISGALSFANGQTATARQFCLLAQDGLESSIRAAPGTMALLLAGKAIGEPVASYGPFVMNTRAEIMLAVNDFQAGKMGHLEAKSES
jgi:quercetin 2,3-dioxygenase